MLQTQSTDIFGHKSENAPEKPSEKFENLIHIRFIFITFSLYFDNSKRIHAIFDLYT